MADQDQRRLERDAAQGDPGAEARWLLARVRRGELDQGRLRALALCSHVPSRLAQGWRLGTYAWLCPSCDPEDMCSSCGAGYGFACWAGLICSLDRETAVRASVAAAEVARPVWLAAYRRALAEAAARIDHATTRERAVAARHRGQLLGEIDRQISAAIATTRAWLACPCPRHEEAWRVAATHDDLQAGLDWTPGPRECWRDHREEIVAATEPMGAEVPGVLVRRESQVRRGVEEELRAWVLGGTRRPRPGHRPVEVEDAPVEPRG